jgi:hypothetical protein
MSDVKSLRTSHLIKKDFKHFVNSFNNFSIVFDTKSKSFKTKKS